MKKHSAIFCLILSAILMTACSSPFAADPTLRLSSALDVDISKGEITQSSDTHGGFLGDGCLFMTLDFDDEDGQALAAQLTENPAWSSLPLTDHLSTLLYGISGSSPSVGPYSVGPYVTDSDGNALFPAVENGYYCFIDRYSDATDPKDDTEVLSRHSFNFTIAIYDTDNNQLSYCEFDT
ncbi:hypothetical protein OBV_24530 [Oscillibacter valericigenes Sjm18-20]|nr:hypothetical protein OBV_24530 [Oscillibacter valericigenes Sjm18-20]